MIAENPEQVPGNAWIKRLGPYGAIGMAIILITVCALILLFDWRRSSRVQGVAFPCGSPQLLFAENGGKINQIWHANGSEVEAGARLLSFAEPADERLASLIDAYVAESLELLDQRKPLNEVPHIANASLLFEDLRDLRNSVSEWNTFNSSKLLATNIRSLDREISATADEIEAMGAVVELATRQLVEARERYTFVYESFQERLLGRLEVEDQVLLVSDAEILLGNSRNKLAEKASAKTQLENRKRILQEEHRSRMIEIELDVRTNLIHIREALAEWINRTHVIADRSGQVFFSPNAELGQLAERGQILALVTNQKTTYKFRFNLDANKYQAPRAGELATVEIKGKNAGKNRRYRGVVATISGVASSGEIYVDVLLFAHEAVRYEADHAPIPLEPVSGWLRSGPEGPIDILFGSRLGTPQRSLDTAPECAAHA